MWWRVCTFVQILHINRIYVEVLFRNLHVREEPPHLIVRSHWPVCRTKEPSAANTTAMVPSAHLTDGLAVAHFDGLK